MQIYHFIIDLDERGTFKAHVEHSETGEIIFELNNEDEDGNCEPLRIVEDGFMDNIKDMNGLHGYLGGIDLINPEDKIIYKG
jgi:hypothetical protein